MNCPLVLFSLCIVFFAGLPYFFPIASLLSKHILLNTFFKQPASRNTDIPSAGSWNLLYGRSTYSSATLIPRYRLPTDLSSSTAQPSGPLPSPSQEALEALVVDLHHTLQVERERIRQMEQEIRALRMADKFLKDRVDSIEGRAYKREYHDISLGSTTPMDVVSEHIDAMQRRQEHSDSLLREFSRRLELEKERTSALSAEVQSLHKSEASLMGRINNLEAKVAILSPSSSRQTHAFDHHEDTVHKH